MKFLISLCLLIFGIPIAVVGLLDSATSSICGYEVFSVDSSPDREHKVVVFQRDCGATSGFSTQISIIHSSEELKNESGNIYIVDGHPRDVSPEVRWLSNSELRIKRSLNGSEYKAELKWGFLNLIKITYGADSSL